MRDQNINRHSLLVVVPLVGVPLLVVVLLLVTADAGIAQQGVAPDVATAGNVLTADQIVERAIVRAERQRARGDDTSFEGAMKVVTDTLNGDGEVTDSESARYRRYSINGALFDEMVAKDGQPLTEQEREEERQRREEFGREVEERIARGLPPQPEEERRVRFDRYLMDRYVTAVVGEETVRGHRCWIISMKPRDGDLPERNRMDKALNRANGRIWVAQDDFGVARVEFVLNEPINYLGGLLARVRKTDGRIEIERVEPEVWLPSEFELQLDLRVLFKNIRRVIRTSWTGYRRTMADADGSPR